MPTTSHRRTEKATSSDSSIDFHYAGFYEFHMEPLFGGPARWECRGQNRGAGSDAHDCRAQYTGSIVPTRARKYDQYVWVLYLSFSWSLLRPRGRQCTVASSDRYLGHRSGNEVGSRYSVGAYARWRPAGTVRGTNAWEFSVTSVEHCDAVKPGLLSAESQRCGCRRLRDAVQLAQRPANSGDRGLSG